MAVKLPKLWKFGSVTQILQDTEALKDYISVQVANHNTTTSSHQDIRSQVVQNNANITTLSTLVEDTAARVNSITLTGGASDITQADLTEHKTDIDAHKDTINHRVLESADGKYRYETRIDKDGISFTTTWLQNVDMQGTGSKHTLIFKNDGLTLRTNYITPIGTVLSEERVTLTSDTTGIFRLLNAKRMAIQAITAEIGGTDQTIVGNSETAMTQIQATNRIDLKVNTLSGDTGQITASSVSLPFLKSSEADNKHITTKEYVLDAITSAINSAINSTGSNDNDVGGRWAIIPDGTEGSTRNSESLAARALSAQSPRVLNDVVFDAPIEELTFGAHVRPGFPQEGNFVIHGKYIWYISSKQQNTFRSEIDNIEYPMYTIVLTEYTLSGLSDELLDQLREELKTLTENQIRELIRETSQGNVEFLELRMNYLFALYELPVLTGKVYNFVRYNAPPELPTAYQLASGGWRRDKLETSPDPAEYLPGDIIKKGNDYNIVIATVDGRVMYHRANGLDKELVLMRLNLAEVGTSVGQQGPKGDKGDKGDTGEQGPQGPKGDKGDAGSSSISKSEMLVSDGNGGWSKTGWFVDKDGGIWAQGLANPSDWGSYKKLRLFIDAEVDENGNVTNPNNSPTCTFFPAGFASTSGVDEYGNVANEAIFMIGNGFRMRELHRTITIFPQGWIQMYDDGIYTEYTPDHIHANILSEIPYTISVSGSYYADDLFFKIADSGPDSVGCFQIKLVDDERTRVVLQAPKTNIEDITEAKDLTTKEYVDAHGINYITTSRTSDHGSTSVSKSIILDENPDNINVNPTVARTLHFNITTNVQDIENRRLGNVSQDYSLATIESIYPLLNMAGSSSDGVITSIIVNSTTADLTSMTYVNIPTEAGIAQKLAILLDQSSTLTQVIGVETSQGEAMPIVTMNGHQATLNYRSTAADIAAHGGLPGDTSLVTAGAVRQLFALPSTISAGGTTTYEGFVIPLLNTANNTLSTVASFSSQGIVNYITNKINALPAITGVQHFVLATPPGGLQSIAGQPVFFSGAGLANMNFVVRYNPTGIAKDVIDTILYSNISDASLASAFSLKCLIPTITPNAVSGNTLQFFANRNSEETVYPSVVATVYDKDAVDALIAAVQATVAQPSQQAGVNTRVLIGTQTWTWAKAFAKDYTLGETTVSVPGVLVGDIVSVDQVSGFWPQTSSSTSNTSLTWLQGVGYVSAPDTVTFRIRNTGAAYIFDDENPARFVISVYR